MFLGLCLVCPSWGRELASESAQAYIHVRNNTCFALLHLDFSVCNWEDCLHQGKTPRWKRKCLFRDDSGLILVPFVCGLHPCAIIHSFLCAIIHSFHPLLNIYRRLVIYQAGSPALQIQKSSKRIGPLLKGLIMYTYIFHQKTYKNVCSFIIRKGYLSYPFSTPTLYQSPIPLKKKKNP